MRAWQSTPHAMLSRQVVGVMTKCLVMALPGSPTAVAECLDAVWPALPHALALISGDTRHPEQPDTAMASQMYRMPIASTTEMVQFDAVMRCD